MAPPSKKEPLSAYEQERLDNIRRNKRQLQELGLDTAARDVRPPAKRSAPKPKRQAQPAAAPLRKSSRRLGDAPSPGAAGGDFATAAEVAAVLDRAYRLDLRPLPRADRKTPTLTAAQAAFLEGMEGAPPLSVDEVAAVHAARRDVVGKGTGGGYMGRNTWEEKRSLLRATAGLRWPAWLEGLATCSIGMGRTDEAKNQTLYLVERAACGLGLEYKHWPEGVGVLLGGLTEAEMAGVPLAGGAAPGGAVQAAGMAPEVLRREVEAKADKVERAATAKAAAEAAKAAAVAAEEEAAAVGEAAAADGTSGEAAAAGEVAGEVEAAPEEGEGQSAAEEAAEVDVVAVLPVGRLLTLGSDTESLKREGQRLEAKYAKDKGNGWAYNHALGKLRLYQEILLREAGHAPPEGPTIEDMEEGVAVGGGV